MKKAVKEAKEVEISKIQLFLLLQDTVTHIKFKRHLASNYGHVKNQVISLFGRKKATSLETLVYIGEIYTRSGIEEEFNNYLIKFNMVDTFNDQLNKMIG